MRPLRTLLSNVKIKLCMAAAVVGVFGLIASPMANATPTGTASFYNDPTTSPPDTLRFTLNCGSATGDCGGKLAVLYSPSTFDSTNPLVGGVFYVHPSSPAAEAAFVDANVTGATFTTGTKTDESGDTADFTTSAEYIIIKIGGSNDHLSDALIQNLYGPNLHLFFNDTTGTGSGFSHYTEFGTATRVSVPEPAALGMLGFGVLLIGLFAGLRRRYD